eukprot:6488676-Amphidinium_carterae.2
MAMDPFFSVDAAVLVEMTGETGEEMLKSRLRDAVRSAAPSIANAAESGKRIGTSENLQWCREAVRNEISLGVDMVNRMHAGETIACGASASTAWLASLLTELNNYTTWTVPALKSEPDAKESEKAKAPSTYSGYEALRLRLESMAAKAPSKLEDLQPFVMWSHLLSQSESDSVAELRKRLVQTGAAVMSKPHEKKEGKKASASKKSSDTSTLLDEAALALLGCKSTSS